MKNIIDSLFLELGIDTSKFSADQQRALAKIQQFESQTKRSAGKAAGQVRTVGKAFRELADDTAIGATSRRLDTMSMKLRSLGQSARVSGGIGTPFGLMAEGLGSLLSPATMALAAVTLLGKGVWDFDKKMTAANATIFRQAQLSGMNAKGLWAWGEAARTVGAQPQEISAGIASLQTAITGMGIGAGNASAQLVALARLKDVGWNFRSGVNVRQLFERVHQLAKRNGYQNLGALRALTMPLMNDAMFALATSPNFNPAQIQRQIRNAEPKDFGAVLAGAVKSQQKLGLLGVSKDTLMERAYGATHNVFDAMAVGIQQLVGLVGSILNFIRHPLKGTEHAVKSAVKWVGRTQERISEGESALTAGLPPALARQIAVAPQAAGELLLSNLISSYLQGLWRRWRGGQVKGAAALSQGMAPALAREIQAGPDAAGTLVLGNLIAGYLERLWHGAARGVRNNNPGNLKYAGQPGAVGQDANGFAIFATAAEGVAAMRRQLELDRRRGLDTVSRIVEKWAPPGRNDTDAYITSVARSLHVGANDRLRLRDPAVMSALMDAMIAQENGFDPYGISALRMMGAVHVRHTAVTSTATHHTRIGDIHVHTPTTDPHSHAAAVRRNLSTQPLLGPVGQHQVTLATRGAG